MKKPRRARKYLALRGDFLLFSLDKTCLNVYNLIIERRWKNGMGRIEKALQIAANVITILTGLITIIAFLKG